MNDWTGGGEIEAQQATPSHHKDGETGHMLLY